MLLDMYKSYGLSIICKYSKHLRVKQNLLCIHKLLSYTKHKLYHMTLCCLSFAVENVIIIYAIYYIRHIQDIYKIYTSIYRMDINGISELIRHIHSVNIVNMYNWIYFKL